MARPKTEKSDYIKLSGVTVDPSLWEELGSFYPSYGMRSKVVRTLLRRHVSTLRKLVERNAPDLSDALVSATEANEG